MTAYSAIHAKSATTGGATVDVVTLSPDYVVVEIVNRSASTDLWVRTDHVDPTVAGDECYPIQPGGFSRLLHAPGVTNTEVRLISTGACAYTVAGNL